MSDTVNSFVNFMEQYHKIILLKMWTCSLAVHIFGRTNSSFPLHCMKKIKMKLPWRGHEGKIYKKGEQLFFKLKTRMRLWLAVHYTLKSCHVHGSESFRTRVNSVENMEIVDYPTNIKSYLIREVGMASTPQRMSSSNIFLNRKEEDEFPCQFVSWPMSGHT